MACEEEILLLRFIPLNNINCLVFVADKSWFCMRQNKFLNAFWVDFSLQRFKCRLHELLSPSSCLNLDAWVRSQANA